MSFENLSPPPNNISYAPDLTVCTTIYFILFCFILFIKLLVPFLSDTTISGEIKNERLSFPNSKRVEHHE